MPATPWKIPPLIKAYEALGAIGDGRVRIEDERLATVTSSDGSKTYEVETSADGREIASNDNASYWQGYVGYPAIAVLIARGFYRPPANVTDALAGVAWKELNRKYKNDWAKTIADVDTEMEQGGHDPDAVRSEAEAVLTFLRALRPVRAKRSRPATEKPGKKKSLK
ncbi:MAG TPA: hypothetical protein VK884_09180 [Verrucomicrobiae bacterium]|jgi:hypothetical protein|nr:hypothetical protein [Verrucomicrobiae bacterium]